MSEPLSDRFDIMRCPECGAITEPQGEPRWWCNGVSMDVADDDCGDHPETHPRAEMSRVTVQALQVVNP